MRRDRAVGVPDGVETGNHWERHARQWRHVGLPLRPSPDDVRIMQNLIRSLDPGRFKRALLFGVTPELATMDWPDGTRLLAVDRSEGMIRHVWPRSGLTVAAHVICGNWNRLPVADGSLDMVVGDGFYTPQTYPGDYLRLGAELHRALRPGGCYLIRVFVRPEEREGMDAIQRDFLAAGIGTFHALKWRIAMALHGSLEDGVRLADVWRHWTTMRAEAERLGIAPAWPPEEISTIDAYRDMEARYTFPTLAELREILGAHFIELACHVPGYELGDRCPILMLTRR